MGSATPNPRKDTHPYPDYHLGSDDECDEGMSVPSLSIRGCLDPGDEYHHSLNDYQMRLLLLEQQHKKRLLQSGMRRPGHHSRPAQAPRDAMPEYENEKTAAYGLQTPIALTTPIPATHSRIHYLLKCSAVFVLLFAAVSLTPFRPPLWTQNPRDWSATAGEHASGGPEPPVFPWNEIPTLPELEYVPCYYDMQCARLELPMDYWNGTTDKKISLAILKVPATVSVDDPRYRGPVLINPGGPGGSGVELAYRSGKGLQSIIQGAFETGSDERYFDLVGFDPRGVGLTLGSISCSGTFSESESWRIRVMEEGTITSSDAALGRLWRMSEALSGHCADVEEESIQHFLTTASVARDMVELVEASARWRQRQLRLLKSDILVKPEEEKLQYWGFSYGSYLGATFAAMFPDRVGRLIIDGVVDADDYTQAKWYNNLMDTERGFDLFYYHCARVGYPTCRLAEKKSPTPEKVRKRANDIVASMWHDPIVVREPLFETISWSDIRRLFFGVIYGPVAGFPFLANVLADLEQRDGRSLAELIRFYHSVSCPTMQWVSGLDHPNIFPLRNATFHFSPQDPFAGAAIACADGDPRTDTTKADFVKHVEELQALSPTIGDMWAGIVLPCIKYPLRPGYRYTGPWKGDTAHPLLLIGNTADPVTPLGSAKKMAKGYKGARVLTQNNPGHCSLSGYSTCTLKYIHEYFFEGTLPPEGTVCEVETVPFGPGPGEVAVAEEVRVAAEEHGKLAKTLRDVGGGLGDHGTGFGRLDVRKLA